LPSHGRQLHGGEAVHYLDGNRFEWWFLEQRGLVPPTEAITLNNGLSPPASYHSREDRLY